MDLMAFLGYLAIPCIVCFVVGVLLLVLEMLMPGFGVAGVTGVIAFVAVIVMQFATNTPWRAMVVTAVMVVVLAILVVLSLRSFQKGLLSKSRIVNNQAIEQTPENESLELVGQTGIAITALRPTGMATVDGQRVNVESAGDFIEAGSPIVVIGVEGLRVLVAARV